MKSARTSAYVSRKSHSVQRSANERTHERVQCSGDSRSGGRGEGPFCRLYIPPRQTVEGRRERHGPRAPLPIIIMLNSGQIISSQLNSFVSGSAHLCLSGAGNAGVIILLVAIAMVLSLRASGEIPARHGTREKTLQESRCLDGYRRERTGAGPDCATRLRAQRAFRGQICRTKPDQYRRECTQVRV